MKQLKLILRGAEHLRPVIKIDGKAVKTKKNDFGSRTCVYNTDKDKVEVHVYKHLELAGKMWFLMNIVYFIVSLFGIFDSPYDKKCIVLDCKFMVTLKENSKVSLALNAKQQQGKAANIETDCEITELENNFYVDNTIKKRWKIALITRLVLLAIAIVTFIIILVLR